MEPVLRVVLGVGDTGPVDRVGRDFDEVAQVVHVEVGSGSSEGPFGVGELGGAFGCVGVGDQLRVPAGDRPDRECGGGVGEQLESAGEPYMAAGDAVVHVAVVA